jgi:hypothetical protein
VNTPRDVNIPLSGTLTDAQRAEVRRRLGCDDDDHDPPAVHATANTASDVNEDAVERVARALYGRDYDADYMDQPWDKLSELARCDYRDNARAAIAALGDPAAEGQAMKITIEQAVEAVEKCPLCLVAPAGHELAVGVAGPIDILASSAETKRRIIAAIRSLAKDGREAERVDPASEVRAVLREVLDVIVWHGEMEAEGTVREELRADLLKRAEEVCK